VFKGKPLIEVFNSIIETKFSGVAIVDEEGKLVNNISSSDLKGITKETFWQLETPIEKILKENMKLPPLVCKPETTLQEVIKKLADCRVHRIYVIDKENRPSNVITLTSIMRIFSSPASNALL